MFGRPFLHLWAFQPLFWLRRRSHHHKRCTTVKVLGTLHWWSFQEGDGSLLSPLQWVRPDEAVGEIPWWTSLDGYHLMIDHQNRSVKHFSPFANRLVAACRLTCWCWPHLQRLGLESVLPQVLSWICSHHPCSWTDTVLPNLLITTPWLPWSWYPKCSTLCRLARGISDIASHWKVWKVLVTLILLRKVCCRIQMN